VSDGATAILRPDTALLKTAGCLSDNNHECDLTAGYPVLLTITKVRKEREYRGVVVRQPAPLSRVHAASGSGRDAVHLDLAYFLRNGFGSAEQSDNSVFDRFCRSLNPFTRPC
jgi:hypothetical protein